MGQSVGTACQGQLTHAVAALATCNTDLGDPCSATGCDADGRGGVQNASCAFAEEEFELTAQPATAGSKYWFLAKEQHGAGTSSSLYKPGSLARVHRSEAHHRRLTSVTDVYDLVREPLGQGTYGEVFLGTHRKTGAQRAVKAVNKAALRRYLKDSNSLNNFVWREVEILRHLDHPNIVRLFEAFEDDQRLYIIMEHCEGGDLLERVAASLKRMSEHDAAHLLRQIAGALQHIHSQGCVHRDIKPENFLFTRREPNREPSPPIGAPLKLIDFGLSRRLASEKSQSSRCTTPRIGTTRYMAPEAHVGNVTIALADRADMWSMGVVLHVIFTGYFPAPNVSERNEEDYYGRPCWSHITKHGLDLLKRLLKMSPSDRPSVQQVMQHQWFQVSSAATKLTPPMLSSIQQAVETFAQGPALRRLALVAAAREADDGDLHDLRHLFYLLQNECGEFSSGGTGSGISLAALEGVASSRSALSDVALLLKKHFAMIDLDGSGYVDWSELVGIALSEARFHPNNSGDKDLPAASELDQQSCEQGGWTLSLREDVCWRAFDLLSQSSGMVTGLALSKVLLGEQSLANQAPNAIANHTMARCEMMLREVDVTTGMSSASFLRLIKGIHTGQRGDPNGWSLKLEEPMQAPKVPAPVEVDDHLGVDDMADLEA